MTNVHLTWDETVDPQACNTHDPVNYESSSRDPARTPFPWDNTKNGGFSTNDTTWLPAGNNYETVNVKAQEEATNSHLKIFRRRTTIRKQPVFRQGTYAGTLLNNDNVFAYKREYENQVAVILLNFGTSQQSVNVASAFSGVPAQLKIYTSSLSSGMTNGADVLSTNVIIGKDIGVVLLSSTVSAEY